MKWRVSVVLAIVLALAVVVPAFAESDRYLSYVSAGDDGDGGYAISFRDSNSALITYTGKPRVGWVSGYRDYDCDWTGFWCSGVEFEQDNVTYTALYL